MKNTDNISQKNIVKIITPFLFTLLNEILKKKIEFYLFKKIKI